MDERDYKALNKQIQIEEEQKQEADRILEIYRLTTYGSIDTIRNAIQDRQSVLEVLQKVASKTYSSGIYINLLSEQQSLTNQIDYLKSKI